MSAQSAAAETPAPFRLRIAISELEAGDGEQFRAALQRLEERLPHHWEWADLARADVAIVDMDSLFGHMAWLKAQGAGKQVITFARNRTNGSELVLGKPLDDTTFAAVLEQAAGRIDASDNARRAPGTVRSVAPAIETKPAAVADFVAPPASEPANVMEMAAAGEMPANSVDAQPAIEPTPVDESEPQPRNVAEMVARRKIGQRMRVGDLVIDPEQDTYYSAEAALKPLKTVLENPCAALQTVDADDLARTRNAKAQPLARLRWFAGLVATPGELAHGLDMQARYKLARWPQTEREFPRHFRIATAMMKQAATPVDIAQASGAPVEDVIDYINASCAAGWLAQEHDESATADADASTRGNVLSRLRKPFARQARSGSTLD